MGSAQSTHTTSEIKEIPRKEEAPPRSVSGRKESTADNVLVEPLMISTDEEDAHSDASSDNESDDDSDDSDEEDEEWNERLQILRDARNLRKLADFFMSPEKPVVADATAQARCYFTRPSAPEVTSAEEEEEAALVLADARTLKKLATDFLEPERPVEVDPTACGRNYFTRPSAPEQEDFAEAEERAMILADAQALKKLAVDYLHPEKPVVTTDPCATGRNFFSRPSAEEYEGEEDAVERDQILAESARLKKLALDYLHPELPVVTSDPFATGRNYFTRPSAEEYEDEDDMDDRDEILEDMAELKRLAQDYLQPERPVAVDALASCRNYFTRPSAPEQEDFAEAEERAMILADAQALKKLAVDYLHPEKPVVTTDPCATGRNFFSRPSAEEYEGEEDAVERDQILAESAQLKKLALDYLHPELPVVTSDPFATGRNYFTRPSAEEYEDEDDMDDRDEILEDMAELKRLAQDYLQPERPVAVDALTSCRNYFTRPSAPEQEDFAEAEERAMILADAQALKKLAVDYLHPEKPVVTTDPCATGRNFFSRPSAEEYEGEEDAVERDQILAESAQLKKLALDYLHPELPVVTSDPLATGRNYFTRASAEDYEDESEAEERMRVMADASALKRLAMDYMHPEKPIQSDGFAMGRNYFSRYSAEEQEDEDTMDEREEVLHDALLLKKLAQDYLQPERPVQADSMLYGRNYFSRPSAPTSEEDAERALILADAKALKQLAVDYLHPEKPVVTTDPCATGRNFFSRPSAEEYEGEEDAVERDQILAESAQLKKLALDYLHPENPVKTTDPNATGRNYFDRVSAKGHADHIHSQGHAVHKNDSTPVMGHHHDLDDHGYYNDHVDNHLHCDHHDQSDHFDMDEDMAHEYQEFRQSLLTMEPLKGVAPPQEEDEGKLSRSPSSVMLFDEVSM